MFNWIVRGILSLAGVVSAWFVAPDSSRFDYVQMAMALLILTACVALAAFWPALVDLLRQPRSKP